MDDENRRFAGIDVPSSERGRQVFKAEPKLSSDTDREIDPRDDTAAFRTISKGGLDCVRQAAGSYADVFSVPEAFLSRADSEAIGQK
jgi:hypothetical protein